MARPKGMKHTEESIQKIKDSWTKEKRMKIINNYKGENYECLVCNNYWKARFDRKPIHCPSCLSTLWEIGYNHRCNVCDRLVIIPQVHHKDGN